MKSLVILFILAATVLAGIKDKDFMKMWPEYFEGLYGPGAATTCPCFSDIDKKIPEAQKPVYAALREATTALWWFTVKHTPEYLPEEEEKHESRIETYYRTAILELYCKYRQAFAGIH